ncbi:MAG TPA: hypothetical protein VFQ53_08215 [Kofleriaceae bacterium]|nr:hypothetical protein [Kofleriaceae bacterium]
MATDATAATCDDEAAALRDHLTSEGRRARIWNTAWAIGFGAAAVGQLALAWTETQPFGTFDDDDKEQMYVGASKATLGMAARVILPLRVRVPDATPDACADVVALRAAVEEAGRRERRSVILTLVGGTTVNVAGGLLLWHRRNFETGAISFAIGVPFGPLSAFTQPRRSWRMWKEHERAQTASWTVSVGVRSIWVAGTF